MKTKHNETCVFHWEGKPSIFLTGSDHHQFDGVSQEKSNRSMKHLQKPTKYTQQPLKLRKATR